MPNKVTGATDYLTVAGSAGSETYQCPNTAPYIAADTDYIWFNTYATLRSVISAELIGYDFTRTIVKYANTAPYAIEAIMILSSDFDTNKMRDDFDLSVWWSNVLSAHGNVKGNRGSEQSVWTPDTIYTQLLSNFNGIDNAVAFTDPVAGDYAFVGAAKLSATQKKFGATSLSIITDGRVTLPNSESWNFGGGDFTIDCWFYPTAFDDRGSNALCGQCDSAATASKRQSTVVIQLNTKKLIFYFWDNAATILTSSASTTVLIINNWYHIAVVRDGNTITGFINGVPECTLDVTGKTLQDSGEKFVVGNHGELNNVNTYCRGYIDEFRVSKGIARWTADFSASLPSSEYTID